MCIINVPETEIHSRQTTTSTLEQFVAELIDFGPERSNHLGNSSDEYRSVHQRDRSEAEVTEPGDGIRGHLHYDWAGPSEMRTDEQEYWDRH